MKSTQQNPGFATTQRSRVNFSYKDTSLQIKLTLQDVRTWGDTKQLVTGDGSKTGIAEAWGQYWFTKKFAAKFGRQIISYDDQRILGGADWAQQARLHDALILKYHCNKSKLDVGLAYNQAAPSLFETNNTVAGTYKTMQYLHYSTKTSSVKFSLLFLNNGYVNANDFSMNNIQTFGLNISENRQKIKVSFSAYYQTGKNSLKQEVNAYLAALKLDYKTSDKTTLSLGGDILRGTDQNSRSGKSNSFTPSLGTNHKFYGHMDYFYVGNHANNVGLIDLYLNVNYNITKKIKGHLAVHQFYAQADIINFKQEKMNKNLGQEIDLKFQYKLRKDVTLYAGYSHLLGTDSMENLKGGDASLTNNWAWLSISVNPTLFSTKK